MVNDMLTQMESFQGIFFCTTNLIDRLDESSLRRFETLSLIAFSQIGKLTPGDFANALRQLRFNPEKGALGLVHRLKSENALKNNEVFQLSMGFLVITA